MRNRDLGWFGVLAALGTALWLLFGSTVFSADPTVTAFGPEQFLRGTGAPQRVTRTFALPPHADTHCKLVVQNGDSNATRVTSATLTLNGAVMAGPADFKKAVARFEKAITLQSRNTLLIELTSAPGSFLVVSITCPVGVNTPPVADAGPDQTAPVGATVQLNGSGSSDADGDSLTYAWSFVSRPAGSTATLIDPTTVKPSFTVDKAGTYTARLIVNDGQTNSPADTVIISTTNTAPVANAGPAQTVKVGTTVQLDGSGSSDVDGDPLSYRWTLVAKPAGSVATLSDPTTVNPRFIVDQAGTYTAQLIVNDGHVDSAPDSVVINTENSPPVADAGPDQTVFVGTTVQLNGSGSSDVDGDPLEFRWSLPTAPPGSHASLSDPNAVKPTFGVDVSGNYVAQLIVNDGHVDSAPDSVLISTENSPPVADAGPDQTATVGSFVTLDGSHSADPDRDSLTYAWSLTDKPIGNTAAFSDAQAIKPTFTVDQPGTYIAQLIVNDGHVDSAPDTMTVSTVNSKPVADAGPDQTAFTGTTVTLNGSASHDVDDDLLTYRWSLTAKPQDSTTLLNNPTQAQATFVPDLAGDYMAQLIVNDGMLDSEPDTATVTATAPPPTNQAPTITSTPVTEATVGQLYRYQVVATDPDAGDVLTYSLLTKPDGMTIDTASGLIQWTPTANQSGAHSVLVEVKDRDGLSDEQNFIVQVAAAATNQAPQVTASATPATITLPTNSVTLTGTVTDDGLPNPPGAVTVTWSQDSGPGTVTFGDVGQKDTTATFSAAGTYVLKLTASDGALTGSATVTVMVNAENLPSLPPDPSTVAPQVDATVATTTYAATQFLYTGANPIQTGVAAGTIEAKRAAVIRGRVLDKQNNPLPAVVVTVLNHPEFGQTLSRADGGFDLAVNGGGPLSINYQRNGYIPSQRQVTVPWQDFVVVEDVVLITRDAQATVVDLTNTTEIQVARGSIVTDSDGTRQATLLIPPGTQAQVYNPDGTTRPVTTLTLRATEFTVSANGPKAMPGPLPANVAYTYALELSADEATVKKDGQDVLFNQPIPFYMDNFLNFPVGIAVPQGYYDNQKNAWIPVDSGRVIRILAISNGRAELDVDGSGNPATADDLNALGVTDAERDKLATLYPAGKSLWRTMLPHLSWWDRNWNWWPPGDAGQPTAANPENGDQGNPDDCPSGMCCPKGQSTASGSIIGCENQTLGERIPLVGTELSLNYRSDRMPGRASAFTLSIPLSGATIPASLKRIEANVTVAGRKFELGPFPAQVNQTTTFTWDGKDVYGQVLQGTQPATASIGYVYDGTYQQTTRFGYNGNGIPITGSRTRQEVTLWRDVTTTVGSLDLKQGGVAGWSLDVHHIYDPLASTLYLGTGDRRGVSSFDRSITTLATVQGASGVAAAPDGSLYVADRYNEAVVRIGPNGSITTVAGGTPAGWLGYRGEGGPATEARLYGVVDVAVGPDGSFFIAATNNHRILRVGPDGIIRTVAGTGVAGFSGDSGAATAAQLSAPSSIAVTPDGSLLIADFANTRIRRVGPDGIIHTVAGTGTAGFSGDGGPATAAQIASPYGLAIGPDGSFFIAGRERIRRVGPNGVITTVAGNGNRGFSGDGGLATAAGMEPGDIAVGLDGSLYIADTWNHRVRRVRPDGIISTVAGNGGVGLVGAGGPATAAQLNYPGGTAIALDGGLIIADYGNHQVRRVGYPAPLFNGADITIASEDGGQLYGFDAKGRHLSTVNTLTKTVLYSFAYDSAGRLTSITDADNNITTIERDGSGNPTAIVAPFGQRTTLTVNGSGHLASIANPAGETHQLTYTADGLLTAFTDPRGNASQFTYDALGRLQRDANAAGGSQNLARTEQADGYTVTRSTALNRSTAYTVQDLPTGDRQRKVRAPDGTETLTLIGTNGSATVTAPDGTVTETSDGPDPRFGMQSPITASYKVTTGGRTSTTTTVRAATLTHSNDPLSLSTLTDSVTVNGRTATTVYDAATRTATATSPAGRVSIATLDGVGRMIRAEAADLLPVEVGYDAQGRLATVSQGSGADARTLSYAYNPQGDLASVTDPLGRQVRFDYDLAGRVTTQTLPDGRQILYGYDAKGNLTALTPPGQPAHLFRYTAVDQTEEYAPPDVGAGSNSTVYTYDPDKALISVARPDGQTVAINHDSAGRISSLVLQPGNRTLAGYAYTAAGKLGGITAPDGGLSYAYSGALLTQTQWTGAVAGSVGYGYDNDFRVASVSLNGANPIAYSYDADSLLTQAGSLTLNRDAQNGRLNGTALGALTDSYSYNAFGELSAYEATQGATSHLKLVYTRDKLGRITRKEETRGGATHAYDYGYDPAGRLVEVKKDGVAQATYVYDANGNRLSKTGPGINETGGYDAQDRLLTYDGASYTYTANGELKTKTQGGQTTQYDYNVLGNLKKVTLPNGTVIDYLTDGRNRRIGKKVNGTLTQGFLWQGQLQPIAELDGSGNVVSRFVYATGVNVPDYLIKGGSTYRIIKDHLGSPHLVVDVATNAVVQEMAYDEFGKVLADSNPGFQPFGFAGGLYDPNTGLVRFGARDYEAVSGRWTAKDPIGFQGGDSLLYGYVESEPINRLDRTGKGLVKKCIDFLFGNKPPMSTSGADQLADNVLNAEERQQEMERDVNQCYQRLGKPRDIREPLVPPSCTNGGTPWTHPSVQDSIAK